MFFNIIFIQNIAFRNKCFANNIKKKLDKQLFITI